MFKSVVKGTAKQNSGTVFETGKYLIVNARSGRHDIFTSMPINSVEPSHGADPKNAVAIFIDRGNVQRFTLFAAFRIALIPGERLTQVSGEGGSGGAELG